MVKTILFQGDSITDCGRTVSGGCGYPQNLWGPGYPCLIASKLMGRRPEVDWNIINRGISGNRSVDLYARWRLDALNLKPDLISLLFGVNDALHEVINQNGVDIPRFDKFYRMILDWTLKELPNTRFVILEPFVRHFGCVEDTIAKDMEQRRQVVRKIAEDYSKYAVFVPLQDIFNAACNIKPQEYWMVDGVHPQPAGHQLIADAWFLAAEKFL